MKCIFCFLSDVYQHKLKLKSQADLNRFENTLKKYKENFINELKQLTDTNLCDSIHNFNEEANLFLNEINADLQSKLDLINDIFDEIISIYNAFIQSNHVSAYIQMDRFIKKRSANYSTRNSHDFCKPLFRVRPKENASDSYDPNNHNEYFHIPFSKRHLVRNQRYSISGQPMCYLAETLDTALNEMDKGIDDVNVALFFPRYSDFGKSFLYDVTNSLFENIRIMILENIDMDCSLQYDNKYDSFSKQKMDKILADYILYQVLQFPTKTDIKGVFVSEYVLPQIMMEVVQNKKEWVGVKYQSTKSIDTISNILFTKPNENICFVVPYSATSDYSMEFKKCFFIKLAIDAEEINLDTIKHELSLFKEIFIKNINKGYVMDEYQMEASRIKLFIDEEEKRCNENRLQQSVFQIELNLLYSLLLDMKKIISEPEKNGIIKYVDIT